MRNLSWLAVIGIALLCVALIGCGYAKKDLIEKQMADQKIEIDQKIQLVQDTATQANDKADRVLVTARAEIEKSKLEAIAVAEEKDLVVLNKTKDMIDVGDESVRRNAAEAAAKALADAKVVAISEDEKVKDAAKKAADKALSAAEEADRKAVQAAKEAELAKTLPKAKGPATAFSVYFDLGQSKVKKDSEAELSKIAEAIKANPNAIVKIEGHTDNTPVVRAKYLNNWALSEARAKAVKDYLVKNLGVSESAISEVTGFAFYKPSASNDTGKGRQMNRRAEVIIMTQD
jgi:flagellar motor protein MotB